MNNFKDFLDNLGHGNADMMMQWSLLDAFLRRQYVLHGLFYHRCNGNVHIDDGSLQDPLMGQGFRLS